MTVPALPAVPSRGFALILGAAFLSVASTGWAGPFSFSTGNVNGSMAVASRPGLAGKTEIEAGDDFVLSATTTLTSASFTGLITSATGAAPTVGDVVVEIYRVFPLDSNTVRTPNVPTRVNSPSDVAFASRDAGVAGQLTFSTSTLSATFTASNSVLNGIHPSPNQTTGGEGAVTGTETKFDVNLQQPFTLGPGHYFFVPQVQVANGEFMWLSSVRPIVAPGTPFAPDLQGWIRNTPLDPDWLRVGTDIVGGQTPPTFNFAFSLNGQTAAVPEPATLLLMGLGAMAAWGAQRRRVRG